jgi:hypothetical protein
MAQFVISRISNSELYSLSFGHVGAETSESGVVGRDSDALRHFAANVAASVVALQDAVYVAVPYAVNQQPDLGQKSRFSGLLNFLFRKKLEQKLNV